MKKFNKAIKFLIAISILSAPILYFTVFTKEEEKVVRAALDIGSGAMKLKVAEVNLKTQKIEKILVNESFPVQYQEELEKSPDHSFNEKVMEEGLVALKKSREIAEKYGAEDVVAVATASFRKAINADTFIDRIYDETHVKVHVIDQDLEGALGFEAAAATFEGDVKDLIVWDIGGGSYQISTLDDEGDLVIYKGLDASIPFKNRVIEQIKRKNPLKTNTPNPLSLPQIKKAEMHAHEISNKVDDLFKQRIADPDTTVVGIGNIFAYGIYPLVDEKEEFTKSDLSEKVFDLHSKADHDLGGGAYTNVAVTNPILVLGFMHNLGIEKMLIKDVNNADGALLYEPFWEKEI